MKKLILLFILVIAFTGLINAQFTKIGGGLGLGSSFPFNQYSGDSEKSGKIAASFKGIYEVSLPFHISPSFTIFYPHITKEASGKVSISSMMFDFNGHYVFNSLDKFEFYGLAGVDLLFARLKSSFENSPTYKETDNSLGLNIGAGTYMKITETFDIYGEVKYVVSRNDQFMLNVGVLFNIDWMKKHENSDL